MKPLSRRSFLVSSLACASAQALDRTPLGGELSLALPWATQRLDPHVLDDPFATLFATNVFDSLFALTQSGLPYPVLAADLPQRHEQSLRVRLRPELRTAAGKALTAADAVYSLTRSRALGGRIVLHPWGEPRRDPTDANAILFANVSAKTEAQWQDAASRLAQALASPLTALVPRQFDATRPDGSGAFAVTLSAKVARFTRNLNAARGPAFLDSIVVRKSASLSEGLRAFEAAETNLGWLGAGLHTARPESRAFISARLGWVVLHSGTDLKSWGAPGVVQELLSAVEPERLLRFGLAPLNYNPNLRRGWGGPNSEILVRDDCPFLIELADALAQIWSTPRATLQVRAIAPDAAAKLKRSGQFPLLLDTVRDAGLREQESGLVLLGASGSRLAENPPRLPQADAHSVARTLALGVVGEIRAQGYALKALHELARWDLGSVWLEPERQP